LYVDVDAQAHLAFMYAHGLGVPRDINRAVKMFQEAVDKKSLVGMTGLGNLYLYGTGVPQDFEKASYLLKMAAQRQNPYAQYSLGLMHNGGWS